MIKNGIIKNISPLVEFTGWIKICDFDGWISKKLKSRNVKLALVGNVWNEFLLYTLNCIKYNCI